MCGIAGIAGRSDPDAIQRMCDAILHRGPDDHGIFSDHGISIGMRRLAIIDLDGGRQPIHNEDESVWLVFNGEIYNFRELRSDLIQKGHAFYTSSDTEVIVHLYEEYGEECISFLRGMFAFALWDRNSETLLVARDRLGIKPLVYAVNGDCLLFASEINALLAADGSLNELNPEALDYFLTYLYVPAPLTMFRTIRKLLPGHILTFKKGEVRTRRYWQLDLNRNETSEFRKMGEADFREQALYLLKESVEMRMISDVPLGAFLSGGMDSASVVALMSECSSGPVKTFTIGYGEEDASFNEVETARVVAETFGTEHREFILSPDVAEILPEILRATGEPFADSSSIPTYLISRETQKHVTVALSGIGGDEIFMGYPRYLGARLSQMYDKVPAFIRNTLVPPLAERFPESTRSRNIGGWIKRFVRGGRLDPVHRYLSWVTFCSPEMKEALYTEQFSAVLKNSDVTNIHREHLYRDNRPDYVKAVSYLDMNTYLPDDLLFMGDSMSMAHSLELRVPFCDHKLVEFMLNVPARIKLKGFRLKGLMKSMMKGRLPKEVLQKRKQGFMVPIGAWFQRDLRDFVRETLVSDRAASRGFFEKGCVERMLQDHFQGTRVLTHQLWSLLTFEIWCRLYLDREETPVKRIVMTQTG